MASTFMGQLTLEQMDRFGEICRDHRAWSDETFGDVGPLGPLQHLSEEAAEAEENPNDPEEYADCMFLIWDALARQQAFGVDDLLDAMEAKMIKNRARNWPEQKDGVKRNHIPED